MVFNDNAVNGKVIMKGRFVCLFWFLVGFFVCVVVCLFFVGFFLGGECNVLFFLIETIIPTSCLEYHQCIYIPTHQVLCISIMKKISSRKF